MIDRGNEPDSTKKSNRFANTLLTFFLLGLISLSVYSACQHWLSSLTWVTGALGAFLSFAWIAAATFGSPEKTKASRADAEAALSGIGEWAKWMSGIQTAAIAGAAALLNTRSSCADDAHRVASFSISKILTANIWAPCAGSAETEKTFAILAILFLGLAIFVNAWLLQAVASIRLRLSHEGETKRILDKGEHEEAYANNDVYVWPAFLWSPSYFTLGVTIGIEHWAWAIGLVLFFLQGVIHFG